MRTIRTRMVAWLLCLALLVLSVSEGLQPGYADSSYPGADKLKEHGFIQGNEVGDLMVEKVLTRAEACVLLAELYGKKAEAQAYKADSGFTDVSSKDWFAPFVAFARDQDWVSGVGDGRFLPLDHINLQMWAVMLNRALKYETTWTTAVADLEDIGIKIYALNPLKLKRGEAFDAMWAAVNKPQKGQTKSVGEMLGRLAPKEVSITGVETPSMQIIKLKVSAPLDATKVLDPSKYELVLSSGQRLEIEKVQYDEAAGLITIVLKHPLQSQQEVRFQVSGVAAKSGTGELVNRGYETFVIADVHPPKVLSVTALGARALRVDFDEPVRGPLAKKDFVFDKIVTVKHVTLVDDGYACIIELYSNVTGSLKVTPQQTIRDFWGHSVIAAPISVDMKADKTPIAVVGVKDVTATSFVLEFNKVLMSVDQSGAFFKVDGRNSDGSAELDGRFVKVKFTNNYLRPGTNRLSILGGAVKDFNNVLIAAQSVDVLVPEDSTAPYSENGVSLVKSDLIEIRFNEILKSKDTNLLLRHNYVLTDLVKAIDVSDLISEVTFNNEKMLLSIKLKQEILGEFRLEIKQLLDIVGNNGATYYDFVARDMKAPSPANWVARVYNMGREEQLLRINYDEPMASEGKYSVVDPENYIIAGKSLNQFDKSLLRIELADDGRSVEIYYPGKKHGGMDFAAGVTNDILVARVADVVGNFTDSFINILPLQHTGGMRIASADQVEPHVVRLVVHDTILALEKNDIIVEAKGRRVNFTTAELVQGVDGGHGTAIQLVFDAPLPMPAFVRTIQGGTVNRFGDKFMNTAVPVTDKVGPTIEQVGTGAAKVDSVQYIELTRTIVIRFNEDIDARTVSLLTFEVPGVKLDNIAAVANEIRITVALEDKAKVQQGTTVMQKVEIRDRVGNSTTGILTSVTSVSR